MKKRTPALVVALLALAMLPVAGAAPARTGRVVVKDIAPFTVYGAGFLAGERVTVTVDVGRRVARRVTAVNGVFVVSFPTVQLDRCASYAVRVVGSRGTTVSKKVVPECAPAGPGDEPTPLNPYDPTPKKK